MRMAAVAIMATLKRKVLPCRTGAVDVRRFTNIQ
jgi:hypothetical protein